MLARFAAMPADCVTSEDCRLVMSLALVPMLARFPAMSADCVASEDFKLAMSGKISHNCSDFGGNPKALGPSIKEVSNLEGGGWGQNSLCYVKELEREVSKYWKKVLISFMDGTFIELLD